MCEASGQLGVKEKAQPFGGARAASRTEAGAAHTAPRSDQKKAKRGRKARGGQGRGGFQERGIKGRLFGRREEKEKKEKCHLIDADRALRSGVMGGVATPGQWFQAEGVRF